MQKKIHDEQNVTNLSEDWMDGQQAILEPETKGSISKTDPVW